MPRTTCGSTSRTSSPARSTRRRRSVSGPSRRSRRYWGPRPEVSPGRRYSGRVRALGTWPRNSTGPAITSTIGRWRPRCRQVRAFPGRGQPVAPVGANKKELVGDSRHAGRGWHRRGRPEEVRAKTFPDARPGAVIPAGVYGRTPTQGRVGVGVGHNTAALAQEAIRRWWREMGWPPSPGAAELLVPLDGGGSDGIRPRPREVGLQELADDLGLRLPVGHFPPGTSGWNKIGHRMFGHIARDWRGEPLRSRAVVVNLMGKTATRAGVKVRAELGTNSDPGGSRCRRKASQR